MGKCIVCGCETNDFRCHVRTDLDGSVHDDYECEECIMIEVNKSRKEYEIKFNKKVLPYLLKNNFKVIVTGGLDKIAEGDVEENIVEEFPIKDLNIMYCVDIIRKRMEDRGYYENWIDVHWEKYKGVEFEIVDYLCFALPDDKSDDSWVSYSLEVIGDNDLELVKRY